MKGDLDSGEVIIAAGESTIIYLLPRLLGQFRERYPNIHVQLRNVTGRDGLAMIRDDEVDFAVGSMLDVPSDISYQPAYTFEPALIMPLGHPLAEHEEVPIEAIAPYGLILPPRRLTTWRMVDRVFQQHQVSFNVTLEVGGWEVIKRYVVPARGRQARSAKHERVFSETKLWHGHAPRQVPVSAGPGFSRSGRGSDHAEFSLAQRPLRALKIARATCPGQSAPQG
jgi:hypothetical protein